VTAEEQSDAGAGGERYRCIAFGLTVESDWPLAGTHAATAGPDLPLRHTRVTRVASATMDAVWSASADSVLEHREPDGAVSFTVDRSSAHSRFWVRDFGRYLVAGDGSEVVCELGATTRDRHERFVFAHALPVAAILSGYEALHLSAISGPVGAVGFAGPSGIGKTQMASRLVARGSNFLTDDVLAVEVVDGHVLAHPGPAFMAIRRDDAAALAELGRRLGAEVGRTDKVHVLPPTRAQPAPLRVVYHLRWGDTFAIDPLSGGDANRVLGLSFVPYLTTPARLMRHLAIAQAISAGTAQFVLQTPAREPTQAMLSTLEAHMHDAGA
jgi:hypothetical protein